MTNFEKWRNSLTPVNYYRISIAFNEGGCVDCPVLKYCEKHPKEECEVNFLKWAEQEAKEASK